MSSLMPCEEIVQEYKKFIKENKGNGEFPAGATANDFFQYFLKTKYKINDFANLLSTLLKNSDDFEFVRKDKVNYYRLVK